MFECYQNASFHLIELKSQKRAIYRYGYDWCLVSIDVANYLSFSAGEKNMWFDETS